MILGVGTDLVDVGRFGRVAERHGEGFLERLFPAAELARCRGMRRPTEHLAAGFAAREALVKALGTGLVGGMAWRDIEVAPGEGPGAHRLEVRGAVREEVARAGVRRIHLAMTATRNLAAATVVLET